MKDKVIFLDVDGVLNNGLEVDIHETALLDGEYYGLYSPRCINKLNDLIKATDARVVLSSTWRLGISLDQAKTLLKGMGVLGEVIGMTEYLPESYTCRGNEINKWITDNKDEFDYRGYVILDDDSDMLLWQKDNYVNCDPEIGMTDRTVARAVAILNNAPCKDIGQEFV